MCSTDMAYYQIYTIIAGFLFSRCHAAVSVSGEQQLYSHLFTNYNRHIRPLTSGGLNKEIVANVQFGIVQIESLNEKEQQITVHGYYVINWKDDLLIWNSSDFNNLSSIVVPANHIWLPEITPINSVQGATELASHVGDDTRVKINNDGSVWWLPAQKWSTSCQVDVSNFPYDTQHCEIKYANWMYTAVAVNYTTGSVDLGSLNPNPEWSLVGATSRVEITNGITGMLPFITLKISIKRDPTFFELNVLLPAILLSVLMIPSFILPVESGEKISLGVTVMLAYSLTLLMLTDVTPRTGVNPKITIQILVCMMFAGLSILLNVVIINIHHHSPNRSVPSWMKKLILDKLAMFLCCMRYVDQNEVQPFHGDDNKGKMVIVTGDKQMADLGKEYTKSDRAMESVVKNLEFFKSVRIMDDAVAENKEDWNKVARVLDRLFFVIYTILVLANIIAVIAIKFENS